MHRTAPTNAPDRSRMTPGSLRRVAARSRASAGPRPRPRGQTIAELLVVVGMLAIMASVAVPSMSTANRDRLDLAVNAVADAFRFARDEAQRTGELYGVETDASANVVRVFRLNVKPGGNEPVYDVFHPLTKSKYVLQLGTSPYSGARIVGLGGDTSGTCTKANSFAFDDMGVVRCIEPDETRIDNAWIEVGDGSDSSTIKLDAYTGRVLVQ